MLASQLKEIKEYMNDGKVLVDEIVSAPGDIKSFIGSSLNKDLQNELDLRIAFFAAVLDDAELQFSGRQYDQVRGGKLALQQMKSLFSEMLDNKLHDLELEEGESNA